MFFRLAAVLFLTGLPAFSYQQPQVNITGVQTPWDARNIITRLIGDNEHFEPVLDGIHPAAWVLKGASPVYSQQLQQAQQQIRDVVNTAKSLSLKTDQLSLALDLYFRLEALDSTARSLEEGVRRYADRPSGDKLAELIAHNFTAREQFRDYLANLATSEEQNFKVADEEAQRCRAMISKEPAPKKTRK